MARVSGSLKLSSVDVIPDAPGIHVGEDAPANRRLRLTPRPSALPGYDVRLRKELSHRRLLIAISRQILRVTALHAADAIMVLLAAMASGAIAATQRIDGGSIIEVGFMLLALGSRGAYQAAHARRDPRRIAGGVLIGTLALTALTVWPPHLGLSPAYLVLFSGFAITLLIAERWLVDLAMRQLYNRGIGLRRAVIVGSPRQVQDVVEALERDQQGDHLVIGAVSPTLTQDIEGTLGHLGDLETVLVREEPAELILATALPLQSLQEVSEVCARCGVAMLALPTWNAGLRGWAEPIRVGTLPAFWLHPRRLELPSLIVKRATDLLLTTLALSVALPLIALLGIAIKIDSPGPVFFRQRRVGLGGREFMLWKLRSMMTHAERRHDDVAHLNAYPDARLFKTKNDPRVTRVGRFLRRFSLDELPQLFNIMAGDMSLVGPRPPVPAEVARYEPHHYVRLTVVPGLTGPWQTSGRNLITDFEEVVRIERAYIEEWSLGMDLRIMAKTLLVVLSGEGAY